MKKASVQFNYEDLYKAFYNASMKAIEQTGDAYKRLSWFGRNKQINNTEKRGKR